MSNAAPWPTELRFRKTAGELYVTFDDGQSGTVSYKRLREQSPSADNKGHGSSRPLPSLPVPETITVLSAEPVGRYGVQIAFSDGHKTGLYTWSLLRTLCINEN
ncbi:MAG: gamma-butyrobetaine hydroxylase-like domain-containing protein [Pseudomonadota bacterium]